MAVVMGLKEAGASVVIGVDMNPAKEVIARQFGITHFVNPKVHDCVVIEEGGVVL